MASRSLLLFFIGFMVLACDKESPSNAQVVVTSTTTTIVPVVSAPPVTPAPSAPASPDACTGCTTARTPPFVFEDVYLDAQCTQPVAHADLGACATLRVQNAAPVNVPDPAVRKGDVRAGPRGVARQLTKAETAQLYEKKSGVCGSYEPRGRKLTPEGCDGKRVCRQENGELGCTNCRTLNNGCPDYVDSRAYVLLK